MSRFASSLLALSLLAAPALAEDAAETSYSHRMEQGRFFMKSGLSAQALAEFEAAAQTPTGRMDPEVHHVLARAAWQAGRVGRAVEAVQHAWALVKGRGDDDLAELHEFLTKRFGKVLVIGIGVDGARRPEPAAPILDPEMKRAFEVALRALDTPAHGGSTSIWLPVGAYRIGSHLLEVTAGATARMDLRPSVGEAVRGVYGERGARSSGQATPKPPAPGGHHLRLRAAGELLGQQDTVVGAGQLGASWEVWLGPLALALGGGVDVSRAERVRVEGNVPVAAGPRGEAEVGAVLKTPRGLVIGPWLGFGLGWLGPVDDTLPGGYLGPRSYLVGSAELGLRMAFPSASALRPALRVHATFREFSPLDAQRDSDVAPHFAAGAGLSVELLVGKTP